jgi:hypothetical protein
LGIIEHEVLKGACMVSQPSSTAYRQSAPKHQPGGSGLGKINNILTLF